MGNPVATVITSSPFLIARSFNFGEVKELNANKFADDPEFTGIVFLILRNLLSITKNECQLFLEPNVRLV